ncbi:MAG: hypothetical protein JO363_12150 [Solirubrobacterales bacterium]|nr:hypothetical protein [Solirubrobacterales bacterium]
MSTIPSSKTQSEPSGVERDGYALAMSVFSLLKPGTQYLQRLVFWLSPGSPTGDIDDLGMIHFARLAVIRRFPDHGQPPDDIRQPLQLFESNYNGSFSQYIDTFVDAIPCKMRLFWGTSYGFPWSLPLGPFKQYISANQFPIDHYYVRNPDASVKMVGSSLRVMRAAEQLRRDAQLLDPVAFAKRFTTFVSAIQADL